MAIGCNDYSCEELQKLKAAENDANGIFDILVTKGCGQYDKEHSKCLTSPSLQEAKDALQNIIFDVENNLEICIFFAGHGYLKDGAYFLCLKDTFVDRLSVSALSITEIFMWINEANVRDTNIVIDACQAGGIASDINAFLKPEAIGQLGTPSVSVLAASTADQNAREINGQGVATAHILKCLAGEVVVQRHYPGISLIEIGYRLSELMPIEDRQVPVFWGLNLFGRSNISSNPCYQEPKTSPIGLPDWLISNEEDEPIIKKHTSRIWEFYLSSQRRFNTQSYINLAQSLLNDLSPDSKAIPEIVDALTTSLRHLLNKSNDPFEEVELFSASIILLLKYADRDEIKEMIFRLAAQMLDTLYAGILKITEGSEDDKYFLLSKRSGVADLFYVPLRIVKILGWIGAGQYIANLIGYDSNENLTIIKKLVSAILDVYPCSIVAVSDEQTCYFLIFLCMARQMNMLEEAEQIFGCLCHTFHHYKGRIAIANLTGSQAYEYMKGRAIGDKSVPEYLISKPTEFLSALMLTSEKLGLSDVLDKLMADFDHMTGNLFIPDNYSNFSDRYINDGINYTYVVGHNVWCVKDFLSVWATALSRIDSDKSLRNPSIQVAAVCAALIYPDRTPWFIWK